MVMGVFVDHNSWKAILRDLGIRESILACGILWLSPIFKEVKVNITANIIF